MYRTISANWVENGCLTHAITILSGDNTALDTWFRIGFGMHVVDAVRSLDSLSGSINNDIEIRKCNYEDLDQIVTLLADLKRHMAGSPIYIPIIHMENGNELSDWMKNPDNTVWIAILNGQIISIMKVSKKKSNDAQILSDVGTVSIGETFTIESFRGYGITKAILQNVMKDAFVNGYKRCAVVFESQNISGSRFWLKYFQPACYSLVRKIDDRIIKGYIGNENE